MIRRSRAGITVVMVASLGCVSGDLRGPSDDRIVEIDDADVRVLYVGNSLTSANNLPMRVAELAEAAGKSLAWAAIVHPNFSLEEHWNNGLADDIRSSRPDIVVLQQGPSTLPESRKHLIAWTGVIAPVVREVGGEPALYMVWPDESRREYFEAVRESYSMAADLIDGVFIPAGQTWVEAWEVDPTLEFYGPDRFHPTYLGTLAAAQTVFAVLFDVDPTDVPALSDGISPAVHEILMEALEASLAP